MTAAYHRLISALGKDSIDGKWRDPPAMLKITRFDSQIFNEDSLEHNVLSKTLFPPIIAALRSTRKTLRLDHVLDLDLGRSGRCYYNPSGDKRFYPDWSLVSESRVTDGSTYVNLLPGDTKLAVKWQSSFYPHFQPVWKDPVRQILSYCDKLGVRYGFIITNAKQPSSLNRLRTAHPQSKPYLFANTQPSNLGRPRTS